MVDLEITFIQKRALIKRWTMQKQNKSKTNEEEKKKWENFFDFCG